MFAKSNTTRRVERFLKKRAENQTPHCFERFSKKTAENNVSAGFRTVLNGLSKVKLFFLFLVGFEIVVCAFSVTGAFSVVSCCLCVFNYNSYGQICTRRPFDILPHILASDTDGDIYVGIGNVYRNPLNLVQVQL